MTGWPTLDDVRAELRLVPDPAEDPIIDAARRAAIAWCENITNRRFHSVDDSGADRLEVEDDAWLACVLLAARWYRRRDSIDSTIGWGDQGIVRVGKSDPDVWSMIGPYVWTVVG